VIVEFRWKSVGPVCKLHAGPCFFTWVPALAQEELFADIDSIVSVSGLDEDEGPFRSFSISPSSMQYSFSERW